MVHTAYAGMKKKLNPYDGYNLHLEDVILFTLPF